jgi:hypothetical protein
MVGQLFALSFDRVYFGAVDGKNITLSISQDQPEEGSIDGYLSFQGMKDQHYIGSLKNGKMYFDLYKYDESTNKDIKQNSSFSGKLGTQGIVGTLQLQKKSIKLDLKNAPWNDGDVTCKELHQYKDIIFKHGLDLGSGHGSPIDVDYDCNGTIYTLPFMQTMFQVRDNVRGDLFGNANSIFCFGSMQYAIYRGDRFILLEAGLSPELFAKDFGRAFYFGNEKIEHDQWIRIMQSYFKLWGHQSLHNYELYGKFWDEYIKTLPKLTKHYQETFHISRALATTYATAVMHDIFSHAVGSFSASFMDGNPDISPLEKAIISTKTTPQQLQEVLSKAKVDELVQGLKTAILHNKPTEYLQKLLDAGANMDNGHESALFFALKNSEITKFLLSKKANINYTNSFGKTPLFYAIGYNDIAMVELLLGNGANVNQRYFSKEQLSKAEYQQNAKLPFYLYGVSCSLTTTLRTPLLHAAQNADVAMMKLLIAHGASIKDTDENGDSLADYANRSNKKENVEFVQSLGIMKKVY